MPGEFGDESLGLASRQRELPAGLIFLLPIRLLFAYNLRWLSVAGAQFAGIVRPHRLNAEL
jgi:hypothetical protein